MRVALYQSVHPDTLQTQTPQMAFLCVHHQHNGVGLPHRNANALHAACFACWQSVL